MHRFLKHKWLATSAESKMAKTPNMSVLNALDKKLFLQRKLFFTTCLHYGHVNIHVTTDGSIFSNIPVALVSTKINIPFYPILDTGTQKRNEVICSMPFFSSWQKSYIHTSVNNANPYKNSQYKM